jgi:hypothetical protein
LAVALLGDRDPAAHLLARCVPAMDREHEPQILNGFER